MHLQRFNWSSPLFFRQPPATHFVLAATVPQEKTKTNHNEK
jgi:hypothetical protein